MLRRGQQMTTADLLQAIDNLDASPEAKATAKTFIRRVPASGWRVRRGGPDVLLIRFPCGFVRFDGHNSGTTDVAPSMLVHSIVNDPVRDALERVAEAAERWRVCDEDPVSTLHQRCDHLDELADEVDNLRAVREGRP